MGESAVRNPVGWFEIYVNDMQRAKTFYEAVLGTQFSKLEAPGQPPGMEMWAFPMHQDLMGITGALVKMPGLEAGDTIRREARTMNALFAPAIATM